jgi:hypothetical protein
MPIPRPEPVPKDVACSVCDLPWTDHKPSRGKVDVSECVRLLKAELARRPLTIWQPSAGGGGSIYTTPPSGPVLMNPASTINATITSISPRREDPPPQRAGVGA